MVSWGCQVRANLNRFYSVENWQKLTGRSINLDGRPRLSRRFLFGFIVGGFHDQKEALSVGRAPTKQHWSRPPLVHFTIAVQLLRSKCNLQTPENLLANRAGSSLLNSTVFGHLGSQHVVAIKSRLVFVCSLICPPSTLLFPARELLFG